MTRPPHLPLWTLVQTAHLAEARFRDAFDAAGLTPAQFGVLACLHDGDDLSQADLARTVLVTPQSMNRLVADMVDGGLIVRTGPAGRGRRAPLEITERGAAAMNAARPRAYAINRPAKLGLTADEAAHLDRLLQTVRAHLDRK